MYDDIWVGHHTFILYSNKCISIILSLITQLTHVIIINVGVFVSRLQKDTRVHHVERHVLNVTGLHVRCELIPTKYGTYASYCISCSTENTKPLLDSAKWLCNVIVNSILNLSIKCYFIPLYLSCIQYCLCYF